MNQQEKVYILLVNYHGDTDTIECLESLLSIEYDNYQIIVIDNSNDFKSLDNMINWAKGGFYDVSTDFDHLVYPLNQKPLSFKVIEEENILFTKCHESCKIIFVKSCRNLGFAHANNLGVSYALKRDDYKFIWFLNNDTVVEKDSLNALVCFSHKSNRRTGIIGSALMNYWHPELLQGVGGTYNKWTGQVKEIGNELNLSQLKEVRSKLDYIIGASMFVRRDFLIDIGPMDESLFLYYEELDWALRGKKSGWQIDYCLKSKVYHKIGATTRNKIGRPSRISDFYAVRNRILITQKFFPYALLTLYPSLLLFIFRRIKLRMFDRVKLLFAIVLNPTKKHWEFFD